MITGRRANRQSEIYRKKHKKTGRFIFFSCFNRFLDKSKINYMYMYFRPARSRSLFILASTLGDIKKGGEEGGERGSMEEINVSGE